MTLAYVGLGANLGNPEQTLAAAILDLARLPGSTITSRSSLYRSAPVGLQQQPDFINAVVGLSTALEAEPLLDELRAIEQRHGRERGQPPVPNAPRTLDLDLLLYGSERISTSRLTVPHPRMHERAFVLRPLQEIAPDIAIPGRGTPRTLLDRCRDQRADRIT